MLQRLHRLIRRRAFLFISTPLVLVILTAGALFSLRAPQASAHFGDDGFVTHFGTQFYLDGHPFQFAGSNNYYPMYQPRPMVDDLFANAEAMGLRVMRVWAFISTGSLDGTTVPTIGSPPPNGVYFQYWDTTTNSVQINSGANGLQMLDYVVASAEQHHVKLVLPFTNNWSDFGGMDQYNAWFNQPNHDDFYTNPQEQTTYKTWVSTLLNRVNTITHVRYKDDPTIMTWELGNEPRCDGSNPGGKYMQSSSCTPATITTWANEMSTFVKRIDHHHMVSVGDEGFFNHAGATDWPYAGGVGVDSDALAALPNVDYVTYHLYPQYWGETFAWGNQWINDHVALGNKVHKPAVLEEFGIFNTATDTTSRGIYYQQWLDSVCTNHSNWQYWILSARQFDYSTGTLGGLYPDYDGFTVYYHDASGNVTPDGAAMSAQAQRTTSGQCAPPRR
jgi:mannan endo-1,4-beta-mannosidase